MHPAAPDAPSLEQAARRALAHWAVGDVELTLMTLTENVVFRATTGAGQRYVVRIHRPGYSSFAALQSERAWTAALCAAGIPAPVGVATRGGEQFVPVDLDDGTTRYVGLLEWVEGALLEDVIDGDEGVEVAPYYENVGRLAARIHNQSSRWQPPVGFARRAWDADGLMGESPHWGPFWDLPGLSEDERSLLRRTRDRIHGILAALPTEADSYSLIHSDLHPQNIVVGADGLAVIDFDDAGFGWHIYELAVVLFRLQTRDGFAVAQTALLRGYREERDLPEAFEQLLPLFIMIRGLAVLGWANARPELGLEARMLPLRQHMLGEAEAFLRTRVR